MQRMKTGQTSFRNEGISSNRREKREREREREREGQDKLSLRTRDDRKMYFFLFV